MMLHNIKHNSTLTQVKELLQTIGLDLMVLGIPYDKTEVENELMAHIRKKYPEMPIWFSNNKLKEGLISGKVLEQTPSTQAGASNPSKVLLSDAQFIDDVIFLKIGSSFKKIHLEDIDYVIYADRYPNLVIEDKYFPLNVTMKELAKSLPSRKFIQIHQSYIANISKITQINMTDNQLEIVEKTLPIGISFKKALQTRLTLLT